MPSRDPIWRQTWVSARRRLHIMAASMRREPLLWAGGGAAALILVIAIASQGRAVPTAPVQSLTGQTARTVHRPRLLPGNQSVQVDVPVPKETAQPTTTAAAQPPALPSTAPQHGLPPVQGKLTQGFGWVYQHVGGYWYYNTAWDIAAPAGATVRTAFAGLVQDVEQDPTQGLSVTVQSGGGLVTTYSGLGQSQVRIGQLVAAGAPLGSLAAATQGSGAPHLHFAIRQGAQPVNPATYIGTLSQ